MAIESDLLRNLYLQHIFSLILWAADKVQGWNPLVCGTAGTGSGLNINVSRAKI